MPTPAPRSIALRALRAALPADAVVFSDMTQIAYLGNWAFIAERPGLWFHPCGYGTLGYALPAAIGARIAQPQRAIVALAGDFGVQFTLQELMTAVELDLTLPVVVWNNGALGQIRDDMRAAGITPIGVVGRNPDFVALAHACGATGVRVRSGPALSEALARRTRAPRTDTGGSERVGLRRHVSGAAAAPRPGTSRSGPVWDSADDCRTRPTHSQPDDVLYACGNPGKVRPREGQMRTLITTSPTGGNHGQGTHCG